MVMQTFLLGGWLEPLIVLCSSLPLDMDTWVVESWFTYLTFGVVCLVSLIFCFALLGISFYFELKKQLKE